MFNITAAAAKSLQSCLTLCDPMDSGPSCLASGKKEMKTTMTYNFIPIKTAKMQHSDKTIPNADEAATNLLLKDC